MCGMQNLRNVGPGRAEFNSQTDLILFGFCHYFLGLLLCFQSKTSYNWVLPQEFKEKEKLERTLTCWSLKMSHENSITHSTWLFGMSLSGVVTNSVALGILNMCPHKHKYFFFYGIYPGEFLSQFFFFLPSTLRQHRGVFQNDYSTFLNDSII